ncbi:hypothetical protein L1987_00669 [Smallanthus sonchifolius]|uniref:Uncharacterized protein n=1 Tax=Smallanthus sonchifolius TaxID=185202 RepID=A0ACB9K2S6_9ASTR|nr:hypothetical protein L1987_00669 [Smallanthus sonchifolius]
MSDVTLRWKVEAKETQISKQKREELFLLHPIYNNVHFLADKFETVGFDGRRILNLEMSARTWLMERKIVAGSFSFWDSCS